MTYFNQINHHYHRVIFEFTDKEMKAVGFEKFGFKPGRLEILHVLNRLTEADEKQREKPISLEKFCEGPLGIPFNQGNKTEKENNVLSKIRADLKNLSDYENAGSINIIIINLLMQALLEKSEKEK